MDVDGVAYLPTNCFLSIVIRLHMKIFCIITFNKNLKHTIFILNIFAYFELFYFNNIYLQYINILRASFFGIIIFDIQTFVSAIHAL